MAVKVSGPTAEIPRFGIGIPITISITPGRMKMVVLLGLRPRSVWGGVAGLGLDLDRTGYDVGEPDGGSP